MALVQPIEFTSLPVQFELPIFIIGMVLGQSTFTLQVLLLFYAA